MWFAQAECLFKRGRDSSTAQPHWGLGAPAYILGTGPGHVVSQAECLFELDQDSYTPNHTGGQVRLPAF